MNYIIWNSNAGFRNIMTNRSLDWSCLWCTCRFIFIFWKIKYWLIINILFWIFIIIIIFFRFFFWFFYFLLLLDFRTGLYFLGNTLNWFFFIFNNFLNNDLLLISGIGWICWIGLILIILLMFLWLLLKCSKCYQIKYIP